MTSESSEGKKMLTEEDSADAYREMTHSTRHLVQVRNNAREEHRVKPDAETHPLAELDYEELATLDEQTPQATLARACTCARW